MATVNLSTPGNSSATREPGNDLFDRTAAATPPTIGGTPEQPQQRALPPGPDVGLVTPETFGAYVKAGVEAIVFAVGADEIWLMEPDELELLGEPGAALANKWLPEILRKSDFLEKWRTEIAFVMAAAVVVNAKTRRFREKQERVMAQRPPVVASRGPGMVGSSGASATPSGTATSSTAANPAPANLD